MAPAARAFSNKAGSSANGFAAMYSGWLVSHPLITKGITSGIITAGGDILCQVAIEDGPIDWARVLRMGLIGTALVAPVLHVWYGRLGKMIPAQTTVGALQRLALDQLVFGPCFIPVFFATLFALEGRLDALGPHLRENYLSAVVTNWTMWVPGNFINFRFVAPHLQVLFANFIALFWNTYLSWSGHQELEADAVH
jgi:hypothetical protein